MRLTWDLNQLLNTAVAVCSSGGPGGGPGRGGWTGE